ncbi:MAG: hypothetical protein ACTH8F_07650 [Microbacterium sp.]|uniref:hypothetical protein n=1 Tax=Microbacterium sp. TaxID=51671 RepID=UPI003F9BEB1E
MKANRMTVGAVILAASFLVGLGGTAALAVDGSPTYSNVGNYGYKNFNRITKPSSVVAATLTCGNGNGIPSGYAGVVGRIFKNGSVLQQNSPVYNSSVIPAGGCLTAGPVASGGGEYWSHGHVRHWRPSSSAYVNNYPGRSPSLNG